MTAQGFICAIRSLSKQPARSWVELLFLILGYYFKLKNMDKEKLKSEVISAIRQVVDNVRNEQNSGKPSDVTIKPEDVISDFGLESLEILALVEILEKQFNLGYIEVSTIRNLTVDELCRKVIWHQCRAEVKQKLIKLLQDMEVKTDYSAVLEEEKIFWDWGFDSMDIQEFALEVEQTFQVDLSDCNLSDYTFGEVIDCITAKMV